MAVIRYECESNRFTELGSCDAQHEIVHIFSRSNRINRVSCYMYLHTSTIMQVAPLRLSGADDDVISLWLTLGRLGRTNGHNQTEDMHRHGDVPAGQLHG